MGELRDLFEDGMGGFRPSTDEALERTRQRAERRARNRRLLAASVALALAATTLSGLWGAFRLTPESSQPAGPGPTGDSVVVRVFPDPAGRVRTASDRYAWIGGADLSRIQLSTGEPELLIRGGGFGRAAAAFGAIWVTAPDARLVYRLDAVSGEILAIVELAESPVTDFTPALIYPYGGVIRVTDNDTGDTIDIDPQTARIRRTNDLPPDAAAPMFEQASRGYLWTVTDDEVMALPPQTDPSSFQRWPLVGTPVGLAVDESVAWVAVANAATGFHLYRFEPGRPEASEIPHDGRPFHEMVYLERRLWILGDGPGCDASVRGFDPRTGEQIGETLLIRTANSGSSTGDDTGICTLIGHSWTFISGGGFLWVQGGPDGLLQIDPNGVAETQEEEPAGPCPPPDLEATVVPSGIEPPQAQPGMGGGADPDGQFPNVVHFGNSPGPDGLAAPFIEIVRTGPGGGPLLPEDHARRFGEPIEVLGGEGYLVSIEDGWGVWFEHGDDPCNGYELHAYGPTKAETRRFAEGLRPSGPRPAAIEPSSSPAELGVSYPFASGHCGLSWIVDFDGSFWEPLPGAPEDLLISESSGTMTLVGAAEALFEAEEGGSARLRRLDDPFVPEVCD